MNSQVPFQAEITVLSSCGQILEKLSFVSYSVIIQMMNKHAMEFLIIGMDKLHVTPNEFELPLSLTFYPRLINSEIAFEGFERGIVFRVN